MAVSEGYQNYYLSSHFTDEETAGSISGKPMTRLNQIFSLSELHKFSGFSVMCLKLNNKF